MIKTNYKICIYISSSKPCCCLFSGREFFFSCKIRAPEETRLSLYKQNKDVICFSPLAVPR